MSVAPFRSVAYITGRWHRNTGVPLTSYTSVHYYRACLTDASSIENTDQQS